MSEFLPDQSTEDLSILFDTILQSVPDAMILIDEAGRVMAFSQSAEELFGLKASEIIGRDVTLLMTGADREHHHDYIRNYITTGEKQIIGKGRIVKARHSTGEIIPVHLTIGEAQIGQRRYFSGYIRDVTPQQAADHQISQLQAELTNFSRLSTAGTMASAMAHELNQPLTAVANYLEAARDMLESPEPDIVAMVQEALDSAANQCVRAGKIVRKLRDYVSRGEFELTRTNLNELAEQSISLSKIGVKGAVPSVSHKSSLVDHGVWCDGLQIRQVILNLIRNAAEATRSVATPRIEIEIEAVAGSNDFVKLSVADNGTGIDLENGRSPFEPFQSSKTEGMGLGLSICQTIIEAHGGEIWVEDSPFGGAQISFTLQAANSEQANGYA
ncbi:MAG: PAS domain S-box protein [Pseudomonadota bacterium]